MTMRTFAAVICLGCLLAGCSRELNRPDYDTIYLGQPRQAVRQRMGDPDQADNGRWVYERDVPYARAEIFFRDDKVAGKNWGYDRPGRGD